MSSEFGRMMAELLCRSMMDVLNRAAEQKMLHEQMLEEHRQKTGKYNRAMLEDVNREHNPELEDFLSTVLIDASLERRDQASFEKLTGHYLKGW